MDTEPDCGIVENHVHTVENPVENLLESAAAAAE